MKKSIFYFVVAALAMVSCSEEELVNVNLSQGNKVLTASFEQEASATRTSISAEDNTLTWSDNDAIAVFGGESVVKYNLSVKETGTFVIDSEATELDEISGAAFPYTDDVSLDKGTLTMSLPAEIDQTTSGELDLPMWGIVADGKIEFKHLAGVLKVKLSDIPEGYSILTVKASNPISGEFNVITTDEVPVLTSESTDDVDKQVTVEFAEATDEVQVLYLPLPVGTYESIVVSISGEDKEAKVLKNWANKTVARAKVYSTSVTDYTSVMTEAELKAAVVNNAEVRLGANITLTDAITINKVVTIDLNGYTIENKTANNTTQLGNVADECIVFYVDGSAANLTLNATNGGKVIATGDGSTSYYNVAVWVTNEATATINGGEYSNTADPENDGCDLIYGRDGGKIYVTGGTFKAGAIRKTLGGGIYSVLNCKDSKGSVITVSGGKFYEYGAAEAAQVGKGEVILLEGGYYWSAKDAEGYYRVTDKIETEEALKSAIAAGVNTITLCADITLEKAITIPTGITATINLNGFGVTAPNTDAFEVAGTLTINGTEESVVSAGSSHPNASVCAVWANGGNVTINGGHYMAYSDAAGKRNDCIYAGYNADDNNTAGKITINGGKFEYVWPETKNSGTDYNGDMFLLNCADKDLYETLITVNGGQFKNNAPSYEDTTPNGRPNKEVKLGDGKKVYNAEKEVTAAHSGTTDIWYEVK